MNDWLDFLKRAGWTLVGTGLAFLLSQLLFSESQRPVLQLEYEIDSPYPNMEMPFEMELQFYAYQFEDFLLNSK